MGRLSQPRYREVCEVAADAPSVTPAPPCTVAWVPKVQEQGAAGGVLRTPLYATRDRAAALCELEVQCADAEIDHWTLHGVALFAD